jgi:hypothetical protein
MQINKHLVGEVRKVGGGGHRFVGGKTWESGGDVADVYSTTRVTVVWWWEAAKGRRRSAAMANLIRWETRWTELAVCVYQRGSKMIWSAIPTWREVPSLPVCSLHVGTSVGAPTILLGSKICQLGIRNAGMSLKNSQCTNNPIERPIENTDGDALSCLPPHICPCLKIPYLFRWRNGINQHASSVGTKRLQPPYPTLIAKSSTQVNYPHCFSFSLPW